MPECRQTAMKDKKDILFSSSLLQGTAGCLVKGTKVCKTSESRVELDGAASQSPVKILRFYFFGGRAQLCLCNDNMGLTRGEAPKDSNSVVVNDTHRVPFEKLNAPGSASPSMSTPSSGM